MYYDVHGVSVIGSLVTCLFSHDVQCVGALVFVCMFMALRTFLYLFISVLFL